MAALEAKAKDFSGAWTEIGRLYGERERSIFAGRTAKSSGKFGQGGGTGRGRWPALKAATIIRKRREGFPTDPLVRSGVLRSQLTSIVPRKAAPTYAVFGPSDSAAAQRGVRHKRGQGNAPQRDPAPRLTPKEAEAYIGVMREHVLGTAPWWQDGTV